MEDDNQTFFREHNIKAVPRLLVFKGDELIDTISGPEQILQRIKDEA